jgi:hypothetical protein
MVHDHTSNQLKWIKSAISNIGFKKKSAFIRHRRIDIPDI